MADVTGPIRTLPGACYAVPDGMICDDHPDRPATHRVQGETDSMGCEMHDLCDECFAEWKPYKPDRCDWCKKKADDCRPTRDYEEGMCGPVYYVCSDCRKRRDERIRQEEEDAGRGDDYWDEPYDDDEYRTEVDEAWEEEWTREDDDAAPRTPEGWRPLPALVNCRRCQKPWKPGHQCRGMQGARAVQTRRRYA